MLIVGIGETADKTIKPRPTADADAKALYDLFELGTSVQRRWPSGLREIAAPWPVSR